MRNKPPPKSTHRKNIERLKSLIEPKNSEFREALKIIKLDIFKAYRVYKSKLNNLSEVIPIDYINLNKRALISCYTQDSDTLRGIKSEVMPEANSIDLLYCPYCQIGHSKQFDHYLAKSTFAEFSVLPQNLIFVCKDCNEVKDNACHGDNRVFNPYYDTVPTEQFLFCEIDSMGQDITFYLEKNTNMTDDHFSIFENHFRELDLQERFASECSKKIGEYKGAWKQKLQRGENIDAVIQQVSLDIEDEISNFDAKHGLNFFHSVFLRAVKDNITTIIQSI